MREEEIDEARAESDVKDLQEKLSGMRPEDPAYAVSRAHLERAAARALVAGRR